MQTPIAEGAVEVPFFTDRSLRTDRQAHSYFDERRGEPAWGRCEVVLEDHVPGRVNATVVGVGTGDADSTLARLDQGRAVLFVHGYNISFEKGCRRAARLQHNLGLGGRLLLFSWPADGNYLNYLRDLADVDWATVDLEDVLIVLQSRFGAGNVDLIGHSMGARGLVQALAQVQIEAPFRSLTLAAPDLDRDVFARKLPQLAGRAERITIYASSHDRALALARRAHGHTRVGQPEPGLTYPGADLVDVTETDAGGFSGHIYHLYNEAVLEDLKTILGTANGPRHFERVTTAHMAYKLRRIGVSSTIGQHERGTLLGDHDGGGVGIAGRDPGHDGRIDHPQAQESVNP
jgi:esterase/lipase superfamily enzyme